jgi:hypothetical protein
LLIALDSALPLPPLATLTSGPHPIAHHIQELGHVV